MKKEKEEIPCIFYFYLHSKLKDATPDGLMSVKEAGWRMFQWKIPSNLRPLILKELERLKLVERIDRQNLKLLKSEFDIESLGKYYVELGIINE